MSPRIYIVAGPNGAGKSTFAREFLPLYADCRNFINADLIAQGIAPFSPEGAAFRAGRLMLSEIRRAASQRADFGFETTLAGRGYLEMFRSLRHFGYELHAFFLWVTNVEVTLNRIKARVSAGGHDVPEAIVRRRFKRSTRNFILDYRPLSNSWILFDNSGAAPEMVALRESGETRIIRTGLYDEIVSRCGAD